MFDELFSSGFVVSAIIIIFLVSGLLSAIIVIQDYYLTRKGILPPANSATLDEIKALRDAGKVGWAIKRFRQRPENRKKYTLRGARESVQAL